MDPFTANAQGLALGQLVGTYDGNVDAALGNPLPDVQRTNADCACWPPPQWDGNLQAQWRNGFNAGWKSAYLAARTADPPNWPRATACPSTDKIPCFEYGLGRNLVEMPNPKVFTWPAKGTTPAETQKLSGWFEDGYAAGYSKGYENGKLRGQKPSPVPSTTTSMSAEELSLAFVPPYASANQKQRASEAWHAFVAIGWRDGHAVGWNEALAAEAAKKAAVFPGPGAEKPPEQEPIPPNLEYDRRGLAPTLDVSLPAETQTVGPGRTRTAATEDSTGASDSTVIWAIGIGVAAVAAGVALLAGTPKR